MKLNILIKQNKRPIYPSDLLRDLHSIEGIESIDMPNILDNSYCDISGNFNVSEVYQMITSSGYSILESKIIQDNKQK